MALYNSDGQINLTVVDGNTYTGAQAADGSYYIVLNDGTSYTGARHRCGAMNAVVTTSRASASAPNGSVYVIIQNDGVGYTFATLLGGAWRTLDTAGAELIINGLFTSDITGWTDGSSVGGAIAYNSGKLRTTNTSATARARQAVATQIGQRYAFFAQNVAGDVAENVAVGSTTPGTNDYLNYASNPAIAARAGVVELTATTATAQVQLATAVAGYGDWDNVSLRKLTPTSFTRGKVFTDDFSLKADGPLGATPDGLLWRNMVPQNGAHVYPLISGGKMTMAASGGATSAGYPFLKMGNGKAAGIKCDLAWNGTAASCTMLSMEPSGAQPTVANILANSLHITFTDTVVNIQTYVGSVLTTETVTYDVACATDGTVYPNVGWSLSGNTLTLTLPDGSTIQRTDSKFSQVYGSVAIIEQFYGSGVTGTVDVAKVSVTLG